MEKNKIIASSEFVSNRAGDMRIMFYNIFGYEKFFDRENAPHLSSGPIPLRQKMQTELINRYAPDILGMQEYCNAYNVGMTPMLEAAGYAQAEVYHTAPDKHGNRINFTPVFYRTDRVIPIDFGYLLYDGPNDVNSKSLTWTVFEAIDGGKRFAVVCTHFMYNDMSLPQGIPNETRVQNAGQLLRAIADIKENHGDIPVVAGGDLNCVYGSDPFKILAEGGLEWLYGTAGVYDDSTGLKGYAMFDAILEKYVTCPAPANDPYVAIDYIFIKQNGAKAEAGAYITVTDEEACLSSDHCPRFADITFN